MNVVCRRFSHGGLYRGVCDPGVFFGRSYAMGAAIARRLGLWFGPALFWFEAGFGVRRRANGPRVC